MSLRDIEASLPPGFRFHPSDEELVFHYLSRKVANEEVLKGSLVEVDLHACEPWQLPEVAKLNSNEWYFFSFRDRKYATGFRTNRATTSGYWKATGKDRMVHDPRKRAIVGMRKTLVFYLNRAPNGIKTGWIMHEFRLENPHMPPKEDWVLCRVFNKSRGEISNNLNPNFMFENSTALATSSLSNHTMIPNFDHSQKVNSSELNNSNFLQLSQEVNNTSMISEINSNGEDEFGFLFGMSFEESSLGDHVHPNLGEMRFEDDGSLIFL